jgi:oxygen-independent coproporphyrinogen-3 oxidase
MKKNLELYVHTPFCMKKCGYCDFLSFPADERTQLAYVKALIREIDYYGPRMTEYEVSTIFVGGGTPSWLSENTMQEIFDALYRNFSVKPDAEVTIECNPGTLTARKLLVYKGCGINRLSIGLQSVDNEELKILGRIHTYEQFLKSYEMARMSGYRNINIDLMSGLPRQTPEGFVKGLKKIISLKPEHLSVYSLIIEKGTPFYDTYKFDVVKREAGMETEELPSEDDEYRMYKETQIRLAEAGYRQYEISNFAHPGKECVHNIGYWTRENYLGLGLGASSMVDNVRYTNLQKLYDYMEGTQTIKERKYSDYEDCEEPEGLWIGNSLHERVDTITRKAQMEEFMFLGLRMNRGVARRDFEENFGVPIEAIYRDQIEKLKQEQLLAVREGRIMLTDRGMDLSNYAMSNFLLTIAN